MRKHPMVADALDRRRGVDHRHRDLARASTGSPTSADTAAHKIDTLYDVLLICSVPIFVLVMTVAIYSVVKFRAKPGDMSDGAPIHGNTRLEIIWVTIPFLMVTGLAIYGWVVLDDVEAKKPNERVINVMGQQFTWHFEYAKAAHADPGPAAARAGPGHRNRSCCPRTDPVYFRIYTKDVIHSFWVPEFRLKSDAVPGHHHAHPAHAQPHRQLQGGLRRALRPRPLDDARARARRAAGRSSTPGSPGQAKGRPRLRPAPPGGGAQQHRQRRQGHRSPPTAAAAATRSSDAGATGTVGPDLDKLVAERRQVRQAARREPGSSTSPNRSRTPTPSRFPGFPKDVMPATFGPVADARSS